MMRTKSSIQALEPVLGLFSAVLSVPGSSWLENVVQTYACLKCLSWYVSSFRTVIRCKLASIKYFNSQLGFIIL